MRIDHVIYATTDLDAAAERIEAEFGLPAVAGGRHEGLGTHNRIVPLDGAYIELLAVADPEEASASAFGGALLARLSGEGDGLIGWAVRVDAVRPIATRLGTSITAIAREGLSAQLTGLAEALREPSLPFFISRDPGVPDPAEDPGLARLAWVEVAGDGERLERWLGSSELPVRVTPGEPRVRAVGIGDRELRSA